MTWTNWTNLVLGILLFFSPWWIGFSQDTPALWTAVVFGFLVSIFAVVPSLYGTRSGPET